MPRTDGDVAVSATLAVLGLVMAVGAVDYRILAGNGGIGPGFLPFVAGLALAACAGWAAVGTALRARDTGAGSRNQQHVSNGAGPEAHGHRHSRVVAILGLTLAATVLSTVVGFVLAFGALVFVLLRYVEHERPRLALTVAVLAVTASWLLFVQLLAVPLPGGVLGLLGRE